MNPRRIECDYERFETIGTFESYAAPHRLDGTTLTIPVWELTFEDTELAEAFWPNGASFVFEKVHMITRRYAVATIRPNHWRHKTVVERLRPENPGKTTVFDLPLYPLCNWNCLNWLIEAERCFLEPLPSDLPQVVHRIDKNGMYKYPPLYGLGRWGRFLALFREPSLDCSPYVANLPR